MLSQLYVRHVPPKQGGQGPCSGSCAPVTTARKRAPASSSTVGTGGPPKKRTAYEKRERLRASQMLIAF